MDGFFVTGTDVDSVPGLMLDFGCWMIDAGCWILDGHLSALFLGRFNYAG